MKKCFLKNFAIFTGKHLCWSLFLIKLKLQAFRPATLLKRDSNTDVSCEYCETFKNSFFYKTPPVDVFGSQRISILNMWKLK